MGQQSFIIALVLAVAAYFLLGSIVAFGIAAGWIIGTFVKN